MEHNYKKIKVIKNLVKPKYFKPINEYILSSYFPWFLNKGINSFDGKNEKHFYSVTRCTHEVRFIRQKKKCDVPPKFF